jgi:hypothetical protein
MLEGLFADQEIHVLGRPQISVSPNRKSADKEVADTERLQLGIGLERCLTNNGGNKSKDFPQVHDCGAPASYLGKG